MSQVLPAQFISRLESLKSANREFLYFWIASLLSILSYNFYIFNVGWYLLEIGGRKLSVSMTWAVFFLPGLLLSFHLKQLLAFRRLSPHKILGQLEAFKVLLFGVGIFLLKLVPSTVTAYGISILLGFTYIFFTPLTYMVLKQLTERYQATGLSEMIEISYQLAGAIGLVMSGVLYKHIGFPMLVACACASSAIACLAHATNARLQKKRQRESSTDEGQNRQSPLEEIGRQNAAHGEKGIKEILSGRPALHFGLVHLVPQMSVLLFNIPLFMYISSIMKEGPETFGYIDGLFSVVSLLTGLALSKRPINRQTLLSNILVAESLALGALFIVIGLWRPPAGYWPYILLPIVGLFTTGLKIHSRSIVLKTHSSVELNELTVYYQAFANVFLVFGAVAIGYIVEKYGVAGSFACLSGVISLFGICAWVFREGRK